MEQLHTKVAFLGYIREPNLSFVNRLILVQVPLDAETDSAGHFDLRRAQVLTGKDGEGFLLLPHRFTDSTADALDAPAGTTYSQALLTKCGALIRDYPATQVGPTYRWKVSGDHPGLPLLMLNPAHFSITGTYGNVVESLPREVVFAGRLPDGRKIFITTVNEDLTSAELFENVMPAHDSWHIRRYVEEIRLGQHGEFVIIANGVAFVANYAEAIRSSLPRSERSSIPRSGMYYSWGGVPVEPLDVAALNLVLLHNSGEIYTI